MASRRKVLSILSLSLINTYQLIGSAAKAQFVGVVKNMFAAAGFHSCDNGRSVRNSPQEVHASLIQRYRVCGGKMPTSCISGFAGLALQSQSTEILFITLMNTIFSPPSK